MKTLKLFLIAVLAILTASCSMHKPVVTTPTVTPTVNLTLLRNAQSNKFINLDYGIKLNFIDARSYEKSSKIIYKHDDYLTTTPQVNVYPEVISFVSESMRRYMRTMGFDLDADVATDYMLTAKIKEYNVNYLSGIGWSGIVNLEIEVYNSDNQIVYPNVSVVGRASRPGSGNDYNMASLVMNTAYANALEDIDWDRIAFFLHKASSPSLEGNKKVQGKGDTALENTIVRWDVQSRPQGADIFWRVVSTTPEVKSTNNKYLMTTPYEATKTLDIKGLTYNTSGNVRIILRCEKDGYMPQEKEFDVRMVLDQEEISAFFRLVKEE
jgi:hypothetical protein